MSRFDKGFLTIILVGICVIILLLSMRIGKVETDVKVLKARVVLVEDGMSTYTVE